MNKKIRYEVRVFNGKYWFPRASNGDKNRIIAEFHKWVEIEGWDNVKIMYLTEEEVDWGL